MKERCTNKQIGQLIAFYEFGTLAERDRHAFLSHLIECSYCYNQVYLLEPIMTAFRAHRATVKTEPAEAASSRQRTLTIGKRFRLRSPVPVFAFSMLLVAATIGVVYMSMRTSVPSDIPLIGQGNGLKDTVAAAPWENIEIPKAEYRPPTEGVILRNPNESFEHAMVFYRENDFARAAEQLDTLSQLDPNAGANAHFYLGVSLLMLGRNQDALSPFKQAANLDAGWQRAASHYYMALAYLRLNQPQRAIAELDKVIELNGEHKGEAVKLKQQALDLTK